MEMYLQAWKRTMDFQGRSQRSEYWTFTLVNFCAFMALGFVAGLTSSENSVSPVFFLAWALNLAVLLPTISVSVRRLHDRGMSGFWLLSMLVPFVNFVAAVAMLVMFCMDSQPGTNKFGPNPKEGFASTGSTFDQSASNFATPSTDEGETTYAKSA